MSPSFQNKLFCMVSLICIFYAAPIFAWVSNYGLEVACEPINGLEFFVVSITDPTEADDLLGTFDASTNQSIFRAATSAGDCANTSYSVIYYSDYNFATVVDPANASADLLSSKIHIGVGSCSDLTSDASNATIFADVLLKLVVGEGVVDRVYDLRCQIPESVAFESFGGPIVPSAKRVPAGVGRLNVRLSILRCNDKTLLCTDEEPRQDSHHFVTSDVIKLRASVADANLAGQVFPSLRSCRATVDETGQNTDAFNNVQLLEPTGLSFWMHKFLSFDPTPGKDHELVVTLFQFIKPTMGFRERVYFFCDIEVCFKDCGVAATGRRRRRDAAAGSLLKTNVGQSLVLTEP